MNQPPSDIRLSANLVKENSAAGTVIGTLTALIRIVGDSHTFILVDDAGGRFAISGNRLVVASGAGLNYEAATSHTVVVRATDAGGLSVDKTLTINVQNVNEVVGFDVQHGTLERSYIRYLDLIFESSAGLSQLISEGRVHLTRFTPSGTSPVSVSLAGKLKVVGNHITADFGANGIGGNRNSVVGNGYYRLTIDTDRDGTYETQRNFYRLFGDTNGDRAVDSIDLANVNRARASGART